MYKKKNDSRESRAGSLPRAHRASQQAQQDFKDRRNFKPGESFKESFPRGDRQQNQKLPDNVSLSLSPKMLELADELAHNAHMSLKTFLTEALKYVILAQGKRLGVTEKYLPEFVNNNARRTSTWKAESEQSPAYSQPRTYSRSQSDRRPQEQTQRRRWSSDDKKEGSYRSESDRRPQGQTQRRRWSSDDKKEGSYGGSESDRRPERQTQQRPFGDNEQKDRRYDSRKKPVSYGKKKFGDNRNKTEYGRKRQGGSNYSKPKSK